MEKYIFSILIALLTLPVFAQKQAQAKLMLLLLRRPAVYKPILL